jgi:hypothetical protein
VRQSLVTLELKGAIPPASTTGADWGAPLVGVSALATGFAAIARSASLLGQIPNLRPVPFFTKIPVESQAASYSWVGEGLPKPISKMVFTSGVTLTPLKAAGTIVVTDELVRLSAPGTEVTMRQDLIDGLVSFQDFNFLNPASAAIAGVKPASITNGLTPTASTGNLATDVATMLDVFFTARPGGDPVLIAGGRKAAQLRAMNPGFGFPVITSEAAGGTVVAVDGRGIFVADGGVQVSVTREASVQMSDTPDNPVTANTVLVSLWQYNCVGFRPERTLNWTATPGSVQYLAA